HDLVLADGDGVGEVGTERETGFPESLDVAHEAKGAGPGDFAAEDAVAHFVGKTLLADQRRGEVDFDVEVETSVGNKLAPALAFLDLDRLQNLDVAAR